jgi:hypothetical protein
MGIGSWEIGYEELLARAKACFDALTPEEQAAHRREQAIDFAYGNVTCDGHGGALTREDFARIYDEMHRKGG